MIGALYNGISGLNVEQKALDNESNNISNVNTIGYKSSKISFADVMYKDGIGCGSTAIDPVKDHKQGTLKQTDNGYDFAISGNGFFDVVDDSSRHFYTRAGNFQRASDGYLKNMQGLDVVGITSTVTGDNITNEYKKFIGSAIFNSPTETKTINTYTTDITNTATPSGTSGNNLKTVGSTLNDLEALATAYEDALIKNSKNPKAGISATKQSDTITFGTVAGVNDKFDLSVKIDGMVYKQSFVNSTEETLKKLSDKISSIEGISSSVDTTTGILTINSMISGKKMDVTDSTLNEQVVTQTNITKALGDGEALATALYADIKALVEANGGKIASNISTVTKAVSNTVISTNPIQLDLSVLNMNQNSLGDIELDYEDGILYMSTGKAKYAIAQLTTVSFINRSGLDPKGDNLYAKTQNSGEPLYVKGNGEVVNKSLELSSEDLAEGLVNLMVFQKAFEANSKSVTTADQFLQTAIQMKK